MDQHGIGLYKIYIYRDVQPDGKRGISSIRRLVVNPLVRGITWNNQWLRLNIEAINHGRME
jgi:hypothetical protein